MTREERRRRRELKIKERERILNNGGFNGGLLYEKHEEKIKRNGCGYMAKHGTLTHYAKGTNSISQKVRDRNSYNGTTNWTPRDVKQINSMDEMEKEL